MQKKYTLTDLINIKELDKLTHDWSELFNMAMAIFDEEGNTLIGHGWQHICTKFHRVNNLSCERCITSDKQIFERLKNGEKFIHFKCPNGLIDTGSAIIVDGECIACLSFGQFFIEKPDLEYFKKQAKVFGFDEKEYLKAVKKVPIVTLDYVEKVSKIWVQLAEMIAQTALSRLQQLNLSSDLEKEKNSQEELYDRLLENQRLLHDSQLIARMGNFIINISSETVICSEGMCSLLGYDNNEKSFKQMLKGISHPEDFKRINSWFKKRMTSKDKTPHENQFRIKKEDGSIIHAKVIAYAEIKNGKAIKLFGTIQDISDEIKEKEQWKRLNELLKDTGDMAKVGGWELNPQTLELYWTDQTYIIHELPIGALPSLEDGINYYHPDYRDIIQDAVTKALEKGISYDLELKLITAKNNEIWVRAIGNPISKNGKVIRLYGTFQDINERKLIEITNEEMTVKMKTAYEVAKLGWWELDTISNEIVGSDNLFSIYGYDSNMTYPNFEEVMSKHMHPEDVPLINEKIKIAISNGTPYDITIRFFRLDGSLGYLESKSEPIMDEDGKVIKIIGTSLDITDRMETEMALVESEKRFRNMASNLVGAIFQYVLHPDGSNAVVYMSPSCYDLWEVEAEEVLKDGRVLWDMVHPDDIGPMYDSVMKSAKSIEPWFFQWRINTPSGKLKWVEAAGKPEKKENGDIIWDTLILDVSLRKEAEFRLEESEERFKAFMENIPASIYIKNHNLKHVYANKVLLDLMNVSENEFIGTSSFDFLEKHLAKELEHSDRNVLNTNQKSETEFLMYRNNQDVWERDIKFPIKMPNGEMFLGGLAFDITEKKQAELELKKALTELKMLKDQLQAQNVYLQSEIKLNSNFQEIIGQSDSLTDVLKLVEQVAPTNANVLILGESGTGKELIARGVHELSERKNQPLVKVNCAALPNNLIESELFGHEKGAFTGAIKKRVGRFELADNGTIFLDEIGELPLDMQVKLLRVLQEGEFEPIGSDVTKKVNVRVIAATNRDLMKQVEKNKFRADLFYRLNVFPLELPPLRERKEDIPLLVNYFIKRNNYKLGKKIEIVRDDTLNDLMNYDWPGNIRELENVIQRAMVISQSNILELRDPEISKGQNRTTTVSKSLKLFDIETQHIKTVLQKTSWKVSGTNGAAELLGLKPSTLEAKMKKLGIIRPKKN